MTATRNPDELLGEMIGQFRVGQPLPGARSGQLYSGWDFAANGASGERKKVWLQFIDERQASDVEALRRQVDSWRTFRHPSALPLVGFESEAEVPPVVAFEPGDGELLAQRLETGRLDLVDAVELVLSIARALESAHAAKLVHFGLTEEHVVTPKFGNAKPALFGLGIGRRFARGGISAWHYLAPEQLIEQSDCDARADVYALGVLLYRCTTGEYPTALTANLSAGETAKDLVFGSRRDPRQWFEIPHGGLCSVIDRAIHADRAQRFQTASELVRALVDCRLPIVEVSQETHSAKSNGLEAPQSAAPEKRALPDDRTLSPTPAPEPTAAAATVGGKLRLVTPPPAGGAAPTADPLVGVVTGDLRIVERIGQGGMSSVYLAKHVDLGRSWVVKVAELDFAADARRRFMQEAHVTAKLREGGELRVPEIRNHGSLDDGRPFIVIEHIRGETLAKVLERTPKLPLDQALKIVARMCDTLERAHNLGFTHRDIKPDNIIIEALTDRENQKVRVIDWGVAKASGEAKQSATMPGMIIGTPGYMPPEAIVGRPVDGRADVFAVACCFYEMLAGRRPFQGADAEAITRATRLDVPPAVSALRPGIAREVGDLIVDGLAKVPDQRPTMAVFRERLGKIMKSPTPAAKSSVPVNHMVTQLSTSNPMTGAPLSHRPTLAPFNRDENDFLRRATAAPGPTRTMRRGRRRGRIVAVAAIILVTGAALFAGVRFAASHRTNNPSLPERRSVVPPKTVEVATTPDVARPSVPPPIAVPAPPLPRAAPSTLTVKKPARVPANSSRSSSSASERHPKRTTRPSDSSTSQPQFDDRNPNALAPLSE